MEKSEMIKKAKAVSNGNMTMTRLYLYSLENNLCPVDANVNEKKTSITYEISTDSKDTLNSLIFDILNSNLANDLEIETKKEDKKLFLKITSKSNPNHLNSFILNKLIEYKNGLEKIKNNKLDKLFEIVKNEQLEKDLYVVVEDDLYINVYKFDNEEYTDENVLATASELEEYAIKKEYIRKR